MRKIRLLFNLAKHRQSANSPTRSRIRGSSRPTNATRRRGGMLVLAIFFIFLAVSLATLIMASSAQLIRTTRHEHEAILLRQLTDSGHAWALAQRLRPTTPVVLDGGDLLPEGFAGEVRIHFDPEAGDFVVRAALKQPSRGLSRTTRFHLPS